jgi:hypothetical protein
MKLGVKVLGFGKKTFKKKSQVLVESPHRKEGASKTTISRFCLSDISIICSNANE